MRTELIIEAPAKINLLLDVRGKRVDGYHELETVMHQIDLSDTLCLRPAKKFELSCDGAELPCDESNLALQAAHLMYKSYGLPGGLEIELTKRIPVGAGLAGGSSDAAAVIRGVDQLFELGLETADLCRLGERIGSDVPFCVLGGTALARGRGEVLQPLPAGPELSMVLIKPPFSLSTAAVFDAFDARQVQEWPRLNAFLSIWQPGEDVARVAGALCNVLESVSLALQPEIGELKQLCLEHGALGALMSGSGPTVFALYGSRAEAQEALAGLSEPGYETWLVHSWRTGEG